MIVEKKICRNAPEGPLTLEELCYSISPVLFSAWMEALINIHTRAAYTWYHQHVTHDFTFNLNY